VCKDVKTIETGSSTRWYLCHVVISTEFAGFAHCQTESENPIHFVMIIVSPRLKHFASALNKLHLVDLGVRCFGLVRSVLAL